MEVLEGILGEKRMVTWAETGAADAALHLDGLGRFRLNAYKQMGEPAVVIRRISEDTAGDRRPRAADGRQPQEPRHAQARPRCS